jgi:hypothetical protein
MPVKNTKMVSSKKSAVASKPKVSSLTKVGTAKSKKGATHNLSLSKIKGKSAQKAKPVSKTVAKTVAKVATKAGAATRSAAKAPAKVVSRSASAAKPAAPVKSAAASKTKVAPTPAPTPAPAPKVNQSHKVAASVVIAPAAPSRPVVVERPVVEPIKQKEPEKKPSSALRSSTLGALKAFELAMKAFNRQNFTGAKEAFEQLIERYSVETEIVARVRTYLNICIQRLAPPKALPRNTDVLYNEGVIELNKGHIEKAIDLFERALKLQPQADYVLYSLAAAQARSGAVVEALTNLRRSIEFDKLLLNRVRARRDPDFSQLYENREFQELVGIEVEPLEKSEEQTQE